MKPISFGILLTAFGILASIWLTYGGFEVDVKADRFSQAPNAPGAAPSAQRQTMEKLRSEFVADPSLPTRCRAPSIHIEESTCAPPQFRTASTVPKLFGPKSKGETTKGMTVDEMESILPSPRPAVHTINGTISHHPIFHIFAKHTYNDKYFKDRVMEFNGAHALAEYDCTGNVDFRMYHQVRAAMCEEHERVGSEGAKVVQGMFPVVDEEYFEYVMTLSTAYDAARHGRPYTFIELGARYGTWIVRAGASYRLIAGSTEQLHLFAVEGNCEWYRKMGEHVDCNHLTQSTDLVLAYAGPRSYNSVVLADPSTHSRARAVSLLDIIPAYEFVDMIDFDIQGFEAIAVEEAGVMALLNSRVGFIHFGTHSADIEARLLRIFQKAGWTVVYFFAGAHTKKLTGGHLCMTPFGPSLFNDGSLGFANREFYPQLPVTSVWPSRNRKGKGTLTCHWIPEAASPLFRK